MFNLCILIKYCRGTWDIKGKTFVMTPISSISIKLTVAWDEEL